MSKRGRRFRLGRHWVTDDRTGIAHWDDEMVVQWDGLYVKKGNEETRHPQEFVRPGNDPHAVFNVRPEQGTDFDDVCGFYKMEFVPNTTLRRTFSITDDLLPLPGIGQMSIGEAANECGHWFVVQEGVFQEPSFPNVAANNTSNNGPDTTHIISLPDGIVTGNRIIVFIGIENSIAAAIPSGWTSLFSDDSTGVSLCSFYRDIDGTEGFSGTDDTITVTTGRQESSSHITYRITDFDETIAPEVSLGSMASSTAPNSEESSPSSGFDDYLIISVEAHNTGSTDTTGFPSGYTNNQESNSK